MLPFIAVVSVIYLLYYTAMIGHDLLKNKRPSSDSPTTAVHIDFNIQHQPKNATVDYPAAETASSGEGEKNKEEQQPEKAGGEGSDVKEGLMDAEELQIFLDDMNIEFIQPDFSTAKLVNPENIHEDSKPVAR
jgi:hypothetical protein